MTRDPLKGFAIGVLEQLVRRERQREQLLSLVLDGFEPDPAGRVKRSAVYRHVAGKLGRPVSNELCIAVRAALRDVPGVVEIVANGRARFLGLRPRTETAVIDPTLGSERPADPEGHSPHPDTKNIQDRP